MCPAPEFPPQRETVFIVEDDASVREALCDLIESAGLQARRFGSAEEFLEFWAPAMSGCLVLDVRLPEMTGLELQSELAARKQAIPIIIMTGHGDIPMVRRALKGGAIEFLTKPFQDDELLNAIQQAFAADRARRHVDSIVASIVARFRTLSERERQVMELVTAGRMNKEIADQLRLSVVTVKLYRRHLMDKMQAASLADLVKMRARIPDFDQGAR